MVLGVLGAAFGAGTDAPSDGEPAASEHAHVQAMEPTASRRWRCRLAANNAAETLTSLKATEGFDGRIRWLAVFSAAGEPQGPRDVQVWFRRPQTGDQVRRIMEATLGAGRFEGLESLTGAFSERPPLFSIGQKDEQGRRLVTTDPVHAL